MEIDVLGLPNAMRKLLLAVVLGLACAVPSTSRAVIITFNSMSDPGCCTMTTPHDEAGFRVRPFDVTQWAEAEGEGNPLPSIYTTFPIGVRSPRTVDMLILGGGLFALNSVDFLAKRNSTSVIQYLVEGQRVGITQFAAITGDLPDGTWTTVLGDGTSLIDRLFITVIGTVDSGFVPGTDGVFVDNIDVSIVPEPASLALLGAGLFGLVAARRRKNHLG